jgi:hypothetical protein
MALAPLSYYIADGCGAIEMTEKPKPQPVPYPPRDAGGVVPRNL